MKNQAMASESHDPAALVSVVSLKCVLRVAVIMCCSVGQAGSVFINIMGNIETLL